MDAQYALANIKTKDVRRVSAWMYEGVNMYGTFNKKQQNKADKLTATGRIHVYVDSRDIVPIGYGNSIHTVGQYEHVDPKKDLNYTIIGLSFLGSSYNISNFIFGTVYMYKCIRDEHMFGGYQFNEDGSLLLDTPLTSISTRVERNDKLLNQKVQKLKEFNGGRLTTSQTIWVDEQRASNITNGMRILAANESAELKALMQKARNKAEEEWHGTVTDANAIGRHLSNWEVLDALASVGATQRSIQDDPQKRYDATETQFGTVSSEFVIFSTMIDAAASALESTDKELAGSLEATA